ncbi:hypothetical protein FPZ42_06720 [Mucilaginibacter achroorhodeus]|uniref:Pentapeptide MXKDX repeat protein n=1 Tax=Mucilaginibacter achroorhodeus TaxID=2599294 RepID=A0A563U5Y4_9SPHI|nr:hypothetical protein [Mucilaginibacter achroorhodeus]TWR26724.1 hypothetical protein FPZ42_06720 [Mucilaginibacter achroorhodeus]
MKKIFSLAVALMLGVSSLTFASTYQDTTKMTKSGKLDRRYNANKHLKKDGTMDMRYKSSKSAAKKTTTTVVKKKQ